MTDFTDLGRTASPKLCSSNSFMWKGDFSSPYAKDNGRPNWSVTRLLGIVLLAELFIFADQDGLDASSFDARWQHAPGLRPEHVRPSLYIAFP